MWHPPAVDYEHGLLRGGVCTSLGLDLFIAMKTHTCLNSRLAKCAAAIWGDPPRWTMVHSPGHHHIYIDILTHMAAVVVTSH